MNTKHEPTNETITLDTKSLEETTGGRHHGHHHGHGHRYGGGYYGRWGGWGGWGAGPSVQVINYRGW